MNEVKNRRHFNPGRIFTFFILGPMMCLMACGVTDKSEDGADAGDLQVERTGLPLVGAAEFKSINPDYGDADADADSDADSDTDSDSDADFGGYVQTTQDVSDVSRTIEEADIVKISDNTLYAISASRGLAVVDISDPANMALLGRYAIYELPVEMYVRDGVAVLMYDAVADDRYDAEADAYYPREACPVLVLDVSNPAAISELSRLELSGRRYHNSRMVGNILYSVHFLYGAWNSDIEVPGIVVSSINLTVPGAPALADELVINETVDEAVMLATEERLYISGPVHNSNIFFQLTDYSRVYTVDISSADGTLSRGADIRLAGQLERRGQMDVQGDVLRTVSHDVRNEQSPAVETFRVNSDNTVTQLGSLALSLPKDMAIKSARFDGERLYVQGKKLITVDMSDPEAPVENAAIDVSGNIVDTVIPRGEKLFILGYGNDETPGVTVSMFDVADLSSPSLKDTVSFGGPWAGIKTATGRIHRAMEISDDNGLILVPFAAWGRSETGYRKDFYSGVQLIDFDDEQLSLRGMAPHNGTAKKTFLHDDVLYAVSDDRVESFNFEERDAPVALSSVTVARSMHAAVQAGDYIAALTSNRTVSAFSLSLFPSDAPDIDVPLSSVTLADIQPEDVFPYYYWYSFESIAVRLFYNDGFVYLLWHEPGYYVTEDGETFQERATGVAVVDISEPTAPRVRGKRLFALAFPNDKKHTSEKAVWPGSNFVQFGAQVYLQSSAGFHDMFQNSELAGIDFSDPDDPIAVNVPQRTFENQRGSMIAGEGEIIFTHSEEVPDDETRLKFFMDRLDVSDPSKPKWLPKINIPGSAVHYSKETSVLVTVDYTLSSWSGAEHSECAKNAGLYHQGDGRCIRVENALVLSHVIDGAAVVQDAYAIEGPGIATIEVTGEAIFASLPKPSKNVADGIVDRMLAAPLSGGSLNVQIRPLTSPMPLLAAGENSAFFARGWHFPGAFDLYRLTPSGELSRDELRLIGHPEQMLFKNDGMVAVMDTKGAQYISFP